MHSRFDCLVTLSSTSGDAFQQHFISTITGILKSQSHLLSSSKGLFICYGSVHVKFKVAESGHSSNRLLYPKGTSRNGGEANLVVIVAMDKLYCDPKTVLLCG